MSNICEPIEHFLWNKLSPNAITWIGNASLFLASTLIISTGGLSFDKAEIPSWVYYACSASIFWFSTLDCVDGLRARKRKCGSPVGRIIDAAGDKMIYTMFTLLIGFVVKLPPGLFTIGFVLHNLTSWSNELKCITTGHLRICTDYLGFVEMELITCIILFSSGYYGVDHLQTPVGYGLPKYVLKAHLVCGLYMCMQYRFIISHTYKSIKADAFQTLCYAILPITTYSIAMWHASF